MEETRNKKKYVDDIWKEIKMLKNKRKYEII